MGLVLKGVMQAPVTPLNDDFSLDLPTLEKVTDFHVRTGATGITWPYHKSESLNMTIAERKAGAEAVIRTVARRVPVAIHVSSLAVRDSIELARHAEDKGADCVVAITPYFWEPTPQSIFDFFVRLGNSIGLPFLALRSWRDSAHEQTIKAKPAYIDFGTLTYDSASGRTENVVKEIRLTCPAGATNVVLALSRTYTNLIDGKVFRTPEQEVLLDAGRTVIPLPLSLGGLEGETLEIRGVLDLRPTDTNLTVRPRTIRLGATVRPRD